MSKLNSSAVLKVIGLFSVLILNSCEIENIEKDSEPAGEEAKFGIDPDAPETWEAPDDDGTCPLDPSESQTTIVLVDSDNTSTAGDTTSASITETEPLVATNIPPTADSGYSLGIFDDEYFAKARCFCSNGFGKRILYEGLEVYTEWINGSSTWNLQTALDNAFDNASAFCKKELAKAGIFSSGCLKEGRTCKER